MNVRDQRQSLQGPKRSGLLEGMARNFDSSLDIGLIVSFTLPKVIRRWLIALSRSASYRMYPKDSTTSPNLPASTSRVVEMAKDRRDNQTSRKKSVLNVPLSVANH